MGSLTGQTLTLGESLVNFPSSSRFVSNTPGQEFLGVLIGLVTNGGARLPFLACCFKRRRPAFAERVPIYVHTYMYFIRRLAAECAIQKPDGN